MNYKWKSKIYRVILASAVVLINGVYLSMDNFANYDEFTSLAMIANLAGKDWTPLAQLSDFHGYGHLLILIPFAKVINNGVVFYKLCMIWVLALHILMAEIIYTIFKRLFSTNDFETMFMSIVCIIGNLSPEHQNPIGVLTEFPVAFLSILSIYFMIKAMNELNSVNKKIYMIISAMFISFGYFIHSRVIIMIISFVISYVTLFIMKKIFNIEAKLVDIIACFAILIVLCFIFKYVNNILVNFLYHDVYLTNSHENVVNGKFAYLLYELTDISSIKRAIRLFVAQMASYVFYSFGFIGIILYINIKYVVDTVKTCRVEKEQPGVWVSLYGMLGWGGMNIAMAFTSVGATFNGGLQWYTYIRYSLPFFLPCVIIALGLIASKQYIINMQAVIIYVIELVICKWFVGNIAEELDSSGYGLENTMFNSFFYKEGETATKYFALYTIIICLLTVIVFIIPSKIKCGTVIGIYLALSLVVYTQVYNWHKERDIYKNELIDGTESYLSKLDQKDIKFYVSGTPKYIQGIQARKMDFTFYYVEPDNINSIKENAIIFSDIRLNTNYKEELLDDNEYMYEVFR